MSGPVLREVGDAEGGMRLDRWFRAHFPALGHGRLQKFLRTGQVRVDGRRVKAGARLQAGQCVRVPPGALTVPDGEGRSASQTEARPSPAGTARDREFLESLLLHRDDFVIALDKPPGLAVQGGTRTARHIDAMLDGLASAPGSERPRLVHRLDKDTSGVLLIAPDRRAATALGRALKDRDVKKIYWALVVGTPEPGEGVIDLALVKAGTAGAERVRVARPGETDAQAARTDYRVIERAGRRLAWLELVPRTGRTHQLRVHALAIGHPIVGDGKYGGEAAHPGNDIPPKLHLHARAITIPHPRLGTLEICAPLPPHMAESWRFLGFDAGSGGAAGSRRTGWRP